MSTLQKKLQAKSPARNRKGEQPPVLAEDVALDRALESIHSLVSPLWPLADYVAVNPFFGLADKPFLKAVEVLGSVRACELLMPRSYFRSLLETGLLEEADLRDAHSQCVQEQPDWHARFSFSDLKNWLSQPETSGQDVRFLTLSERLDKKHGSAWSSHITNDITRHCSAHFDEGQAGWPSPWRKDSLFQAWKNAAGISWRMDLLGVRGFREMVRALPDDPKLAIRDLLSRHGVPISLWQPLLLAEIFSVAGWASYIRYRVRQDEGRGRTNHDLTGLVAMRLAYDACLLGLSGISPGEQLSPVESPPLEGGTPSASPAPDLVARHVLQVATERAYRKQLIGQLASGKKGFQTVDRKKLQMVFCIDVRSEVFRRHLESIDASIETFGFAGFFGMSLEYLPLGSTQGIAQCPVLLQPAFRVPEKPLGTGAENCENIARRHRARQQSKALWQLFQTSATACFSFVESLGLGFIAKLAGDSLRASSLRIRWPWIRANKAPKVPVGPDLSPTDGCGLPETSRIDLAESLLRNLGMRQGFAPLVVLCGHAAEVTNNPYQAALDCGACGGHSGEPNARVAAALLNDETVRQGLMSRNIAIPQDTWFVAAVHNTTTDAITLCDTHLVPASHLALVAEITGWFRQAGQSARRERAARLGEQGEHQLLRRGRDWAEVRPEWGLAGNAALIVAPRSRTRGLDLGGRTFLHSYDHSQDQDLRVLELIMTAPMVVANWINMQYYASTVDPNSFGSGNKTIHNVVGRFGVLQGNGGDLMTGLPMQCVHDGKRLQHEPLRLLVVIEAPRDAVSQIILKHAVVRHLVTNGWVTLVVLHDGRMMRWTPQEKWMEDFQAV